MAFQTNPKNSSDRDSKIIAFVKKRIQNYLDRTIDVRKKWEENFDCFEYGSRFDYKDAWQANFSTQEVTASVRAGIARIRNNFLRRPDWFELRADNEQGEEFRPLLNKALRYHLKCANFRRGANTFLLSSALAMGIMRVGVQRQMVRTPRFVLKESDKDQQKQNEAVAGKVANPEALTSFPQDESSLLANMDSDIADVMGQMQGSKEKVDSEPEFELKNVLELTAINPFLFYFDIDAEYPEDGCWHAADSFVPLSKIKELGYRKVYQNTEDIQPADMSSSDILKHRRFLSLQKANDTEAPAGLCKVTEYFGNLILSNNEGGDKEEVFRHVVIVNDSVVVRDKKNVFWGDRFGSPYVIATMNEVPFKPTGASMVDGAVPIQRVLDSNYHLAVDQMRLGIVGLNVVNKNEVVDPSVLLDGIRPGHYLEVNQKPDDVFKHYNLTSNIENIVPPMNGILLEAIQKNTGVAPMFQGLGAKRARTSAAEINAQVSGSEGVLYTSAEDLEIRWLIPMLDKSLARLLQFCLTASDEQFVGMLNESENMALEKILNKGRAFTLSQFYDFQINGFANEGLRLQELEQISKAIEFGNGNGPASSIINMPYLLREWALRANFTDPAKIVLGNSEIEEILSENRLLMAGHQISVGQNDNDELHLRYHSKAQYLPGGNTPEMQYHLQQHQMRMMERQKAQQAAQEGAGQGPHPQGSVGGYESEGSYEH